MKRLMIMAGVIVLALAACGGSRGSSGTSSATDKATKDTCDAVHAVTPEGKSVPIGQVRDGYYTISQRSETANADVRLLPTLDRLVADYSNGATTAAMQADSAALAQICGK